MEDVRIWFIQSTLGYFLGCKDRLSYRRIWSFEPDIWSSGSKLLGNKVWKRRVLWDVNAKPIHRRLWMILYLSICTNRLDDQMIRVWFFRIVWPRLKYIVQYMQKKNAYALHRGTGNIWWIRLALRIHRFRFSEYDRFPGHEELTVYSCFSGCWSIRNL